MSVLQKIRGSQAQDALQDTARNVAQTVGGQQEGPQETFFTALEGVPTPVWYWMGIGSIVTSLTLKLMKRDQDAMFVGHWAPTFLILALFFRQIKPSREV